MAAGIDARSCDATRTSWPEFQEPETSREACKLGCEGIASKRLGSPYRSGRSPHWVKVKNPKAPAVKREAEEDWAR
jgi:ATP-dependent DNA ligase